MNILALGRVGAFSRVPATEGPPHLMWCVENHPEVITALLRLYQPWAGSEQLLMWQSTFSIEGRMCLQILH